MTEKTERARMGAKEWKVALAILFPVLLMIALSASAASTLAR